MTHIRSILFLVALSTISAVNAQITPFILQGSAGSGLSGGNAGVASSATGDAVGGGIFFDASTDMLTIEVEWGSLNGFTDLQGVANNSHIHGPADFNNNAGVVFGLPREDSSVDDGRIFFTSDALTSSQQADLFNGLWYINVHTTAFGGGEIRGNLVAVPEPSTYATILGGLALSFAVLRRRLRR